MMTEEMSVKKALYQKCEEYVNERLANIRAAISSAQESANDDSKSSAGDKHETGRAMAQLEQEKLSGQLAENQKLQQALSTLHPERTSAFISPGSLVITDKGNYYISISAGKLVLDGETYFAVSAASPIGKELIASQGKNFSFNGLNYSVKKVL